MYQIADVPVTSKKSPTLDLDAKSIPVRLCAPSSLYYLESDELFGELDERTSKILVSVGGEKGVNFQINCRSVARSAFLGKRKTKKGALQGSQFLMNVTLFGPEELFDVVGKYFAKCGIHLQDPQCDRDVVYRNPHILSDSKEVVMTSSLVRRDDPLDVEIMIEEVDVFSKLCSDDHLSLTEAPHAIKTPLYEFVAPSCAIKYSS
jgi:hypothetical protein